MGVTARAFVACLLVGLVPCQLSSGARAEEPEWQWDVSAARQEASGRGKLLLVVQLSDDFAAGGANATAAQTYRTLALNDSRVRQALASRFAVAFQPVGQSSALRAVLPARTKAARRDDFALTWFCLPDLRVLHAVPGFLSAHELLGELAYVERSYSRLVAAAPAEEALVMRRCHLERIAASDLALFQTRFSPRWQDNVLSDGPSTIDLPAAWSAARMVLERNLKARTAVGARPAAIQALAGHGGFGLEMAQLVLAEFPLTSLDDLARPAWEACSGQRLWLASPKREQIAEDWRAARKRNESVLIVVEDDLFEPGRRQHSAFVWPAADRAAWPELTDWTELVVSLDELATLIIDAGLSPIAYRVADGPPRFLLYTGGEKPVAQISRELGPTRLKQALAAIGSSGEPPRLAAELRN